MKPCPNCGQPLALETLLCPHCGLDTRFLWSPTNAEPGREYQKQITRLRRREYGLFTAGFVSALILSLPLTFIGTIGGLVLAHSMKKDAPAFSKGLLVGSMVGALGLIVCFGRYIGRR